MFLKLTGRNKTTKHILKNTTNIKFKMQNCEALFTKILKLRILICVDIICNKNIT